MTTSDPYAEHARSQPLATDTFRVVVHESAGGFSMADFVSLAEAERYADDAASEPDENPPIAKVFDANFFLVHEGRPYYIE